MIEAVVSSVETWAELRKLGHFFLKKEDGDG